MTLLGTHPADSAGAQGQTLLHIAIAQSRPDIVQLLLEFRPNVESQDRCGCSIPVEAAAAAGDAVTWLMRCIIRVSNIS